MTGMARWLNRVWDMVERDPSVLERNRESPEIQWEPQRKTMRVLHQTIRKCHNDLDRFKFNTAIAALMELTNHLNHAWAEASIDSVAWRECVEKFLLMLAPIAPHVTEELWERTGHTYSIHQQMFPTWDEQLAAEEMITLVVQVNGKVRDKLEVPADIEEEASQQLALASPKVQPFTIGKSIFKAVYVPGKLVNLVVR